MADRSHGVDTRHQEKAHTHANAWTPAVDIAAVGDQLVICADLAGVKEDDLDITYSPPELTIAGQRRTDLGQNQQAVHHTRELSRGRFRRTFTLPQGISREDVDLTLAEGLLTITVNGYGQAGDRRRLAVNSRRPRT
ncbi:Hsp20/alpha crystallin family protein [Nocardiopsis sp. HNM0947]|uniref:Hsp20/alpha crystallin family protein n=1 Tax=Nocardiopsis coralli TaxID=2772213 RepID=A0ABR9NZY9_9ACTN|nr:Hsp20/alpha crystallin family protein [Nocardiopsis coralli]MBE2997150.1 Hsp20/alpha crystallin family protein [Nocardiopsis coralli]